MVKKVAACVLASLVFLSATPTRPEMLRPRLEPVNIKTERVKVYDRRGDTGRAEDPGSAAADMYGTDCTGTEENSGTAKRLYSCIKQAGEFVKAVSEDDGVHTEETPMIYAGDWTVTFYCQCEQCCGRWAWSNSTASGNTPIPWYTVAAGESFPFGTVLYIEGFGTFEVMDRGVPDGWVDIYVNDHSEIPSYGMTTTDVYIVG